MTNEETNDTADLLGAAPTPNTPKKATKPKKEKATKPKKEKATKPKKEKATKPKKERASRGEPVDQTPKPVKSPHSFKPDTVDILCAVHGSKTGRISTEDICKAVPSITTKNITAKARPLVDAGLLVRDETKNYEVVGNHEQKLPEVVAIVRELKEPSTAAKVGQLLWGKKKAEKHDNVRFGRAAGRLLTAAFTLGAVNQFTQPRRKYSEAKVRKLYAS